MWFCFKVYQQEINFSFYFVYILATCLSCIFEMVHKIKSWNGTRHGSISTIYQSNENILIVKEQSGESQPFFLVVKAFLFRGFLLDILNNPLFVHNF